MKTLNFFHDLNLSNNKNFLKEIEKGLLSKNAFIEPKFLYDSLGSNLFSSITLLPEYYLTRVEKKIFIKYEQDIAKAVGLNKTLIDLGAGNCEKASLLFKSLQPKTYIAIDFSKDYLSNAVIELQNKYPEIVMFAAAMDFSKEIVLPSNLKITSSIYFYPGSSIGNFSLAGAQNFLTKIKKKVIDGGLLIGMDLMKDEKILRDAYDDPLKVTAAFNLNILRSINGLINSNFDVKQFRHLVKINKQEKRVELYLQALEDVKVSWSDKHRFFKKGELLHTENSHKYTLDTINTLMNNAGFKTYRVWTDQDKMFAIIYAE